MRASDAAAHAPPPGLVAVPEEIENEASALMLRLPPVRSQFQTMELALAGNCPIQPMRAAEALKNCRTGAIAVVAALMLMAVMQVMFAPKVAMPLLRFITKGAL